MISKKILIDLHFKYVLPIPINYIKRPKKNCSSFIFFKHRVGTSELFDINIIEQLFSHDI